MAVRALLMLSACGGRGPASPSGVPLGLLKVVAGDTGAPVAGAQVTVAGLSRVTAANGEVAVGGVVGQVVRIESAGFLPRRTVIGGEGSGGAALSLWPVRGEYGPEYIETLLYRPSSSAAAVSAAADHVLNRVADGHVTIAPSAEIHADPQAMAVLERGIDLLNELTRGQVTFGLDDGGSVRFTMEIDRTLRDGAFTERRVRDQVIVGGRIRFSSRAGFEPVHDLRFVAHELGHVLGLEHSMVPTDMMYFALGKGSPDTFTLNEQVSIRLLLQRRAGNRYPDTDSSVG